MNFLLFLFFIIFSISTVNADTLGDINADDKIGLEEAIYALKVASGMQESQTLPTYDFSQSRSLILDNNIIRFENVLIENEPHWVHFEGGNFLSPIEKGKLNSVIIPYAEIQIDGSINDWAGIDPIYSDPEHDQNIPDGYVATDIKEVFAARDDTYLYVAFTLYDGRPQYDIMYIFELLQYKDQIHTQGDTCVSAAYWHQEWRVTRSNREAECSRTVCSGLNSECIMLDTGLIEFRFPINEVEYDGGGLLRKIGIEGRFIRAYSHSDQPDKNVIDTAGDSDRLMITDFY